MGILILIPLVVLLSGCSPAISNLESTNSEPTTVTETFSYQDYAVVLSNYVNDQNLVNYLALQANRETLDAFNRSLGNVPSSTYDSWTSAEQIAFWLNAYNALTLESIIDQKPLKKSIRDIPGVWRGRRFLVVGQEKTLDNIEHDLLRVNFNEPRIHTALVCAALSCPPLRREPYTGEQLEAQLEDQTRKFLNSSQGFRLDKDEQVVYLSAIFKWFGEDWLKSYRVTDNSFTGKPQERAVLNFISNYLSPEDQQYLKKGNYQIRYLAYDWSLNQSHEEIE